MRTSFLSAVFAVTMSVSVAAPSAYAASEMTASDVGGFITDGDHVHVSSTPPATASAHGWWKCENRIKTQWRSVIDVDLIGIADSSEKAVTKTVTLSCGA